MSEHSHNVVIRRTEKGDQYIARCGGCGGSSGFKDVWTDADTWRHRHLSQVSQVQRAAEHGAKPRLETTADYYRKMSEDKSVSAKDRAQWKALADEADARLGRNAPKSEDQELPFG